jgi:hypothetical protein
VLRWFYIVPALGAADLLPSFVHGDTLEDPAFSSRVFAGAILTTVGVTTVQKSFTYKEDGDQALFPFSPLSDFLNHLHPLMLGLCSHLNRN